MKIASFPQQQKQIVVHLLLLLTKCKMNLVEQMQKYYLKNDSTIITEGQNNNFGTIINLSKKMHFACEYSSIITTSYRVVTAK